MADNKDEEVPAAEEDKPKEEESKDDVKEKDEKKGDDKAHKFRGPAKDDPGDGLPTYDPKEIEFKWNKDMKDKKSCDTLHMLYLLQLALNLVRLRTIERNKYFKSIGRSDRFINQLDNPQIIEHFLDWHNADKENNKFDGDLLDKSEKLPMINNIISEIGDVKKGPATKIYTKLKKDVVIETTTWLELPQPKLKLKSTAKTGYTKLYKGEKVIGECTTADIVTLLTYVNPSDDAWAGEHEEKKQDDDKGILRGVFQSIKWSNNFKSTQGGASIKKPKPSALEMDFILNGKDKTNGAILKKNTDAIAKDNPITDEYKAMAKRKRRWEDLIVAFFEGKPREWKYNDDTCSFDRPADPNDPDDDIKAAAKIKVHIVKDGTKPSDLGDELKPKEECKPYDGARFEATSVKQLCQECMDYLIPPQVQNSKGKPFNTKLRGGVNQILRELKKVYVQGILEAAK
eukprot:CAMPEP_0201592366 /NCGR_PEP_ID=MMETSP0190_2-20130828/190285_1 /ASSEMBLY_ACC=CAM_ASM_000263 /TAXON_ID=37353 /ORGANISM="Rosalina sp." /LENGTH=456 /DNA_ID=CAMNT_0048051113 /DNA_START=530 /DNA_END=1900 /DNA_ORIENTATION=+